MAIHIFTAQMLFAEHRYRPIAGTVVTLGRNTVILSGEQMDRMLASMNVSKRANVSYAIDADTMG